MLKIAAPKRGHWRYFMAKGRINKTNVDRLACPADKSMEVLWDDALRGFGVIALPSGRKTFVVQCKRNGRSQKAKIGLFGPMTAEQARTQALNLLGAIESGADPVAERRAARMVRTFSEVAEDFMAQHVLAKRKQRTAESYRCLLDKYVLPELGNKKIIDIGRVDVARLHSKLADTPRQANAAVSVISAIWGWAARREEVEFAKNPASRLERFPEKRWERYLSSEEMSRLGAALERAETEGIPWLNEEPQSKYGAKPENRRSFLDPFALAAIRLLVLT
jgi:hypothetical protein